MSVSVSACLPDCLPQLSSPRDAFDHLFNVISSVFSRDKGLFFFFNLSKSVHHISKKVKVLVAHDSAFFDHSVAIKAGLLLKCCLVFED